MIPLGQVFRLGNCVSESSDSQLAKTSTILTVKTKTLKTTMIPIGQVFRLGHCVSESSDSQLAKTSTTLTVKTKIVIKIFKGFIKKTQEKLPFQSKQIYSLQ